MGLLGCRIADCRSEIAEPVEAAGLAGMCGATEMSQARCYRIHGSDNVATMLEDAPAGVVSVLGQGGEPRIVTTEPIQLGHKVAMQDIAPGEAIVKYDVTIGRASRVIPRGGWVHLHNCRSDFDERSQTLDVQTGAARDTKYE